MKTALVCGASGFIGGHVVQRLRAEGVWVRGISRSPRAWSDTVADEYLTGDLRDPEFCREAIDRPFDEVYQLAAEMGGAGFVFTGVNDAMIMHNSAMINLNVLSMCATRDVRAVLVASSACVYPDNPHDDPAEAVCSEASAYPAAPGSDYGWAKLFSERLCLAWRRNHGLNAHVARFHNTFGPECAWGDGREKSVAALCRKIAMAPDGGTIEIWGDGEQTRSFLYVDECVEGALRLMRSDFAGPVNIGSERLISINDLVDMIAGIAGKRIEKRHVEGPTGSRARRSDNRLIREKLHWAPDEGLREGLQRTYGWIEQQVRQRQPEPV
jgi:GDP-D-mannose 3',5'-epimerase